MTESLPKPTFEVILSSGLEYPIVYAISMDIPKDFFMKLCEAFWDACPETKESAAKEVRAATKEVETAIKRIKKEIKSSKIPTF